MHIAVAILLYLSMAVSMGAECYGGSCDSRNLAALSVASEGLVLISWRLVRPTALLLQALFKYTIVYTVTTSILLNVSN